MKLKQGKNKYDVFGYEISYLYSDDYRMLNLSDIALMQNSPTPKEMIVQNWLKSKDTIGMIKDAEICMYGSSSICVQDVFSMDVYSSGISIITKRGRSGGIYALEWIACEFLKHLFPEKRYTLNQIFKDECSKAQKRVELTKIRNELKHLFSIEYPNKDNSSFIMMNYHKSACRHVLGSNPSAIKVQNAEDDGYCPSNDFSLEQLDETIRVYKFYIKNLKKDKEYHTKLLNPKYQEITEAINKLLIE